MLPLNSRIFWGTQPYLGAQAGQRYARYIDAVNQNAPCQGLEETQQQIDEAALASTIHAGDGDGFTFSNFQIEILEYRLPIGIAEADTLEDD